MSAPEPSARGARERIEIGLISADPEAAKLLREGLEAYGLRLRPFSRMWDFLSLPEEERATLQVLLVHLQGASEQDLEQLPDLLDTISVPVLYNESLLREQGRSWMRRLAGKLTALAVPLQSTDDAGDAAYGAPATDTVAEGPTVWVLGASFGGPEAVKRFLTSMPSVPDAVFLLAQHIGDGFVDLLASQLNRHTAFAVSPLADGTVLTPGHVYVVPVDHLVRLEGDDRVRLLPDPERRMYRPSIDDLMEEVARYYGPRSGAVMFSGMGNDGTRGIRRIAGRGGEVWAQSTRSCAMSSMPDSAAETGVVSRRGSPEELSAALIQYLAAKQQLTG